MACHDDSTINIIILITIIIIIIIITQYWYLRTVLGHNFCSKNGVLALKPLCVRHCVYVYIVISAVVIGRCHVNRVTSLAVLPACQFSPLLLLNPVTP